MYDLEIGHNRGLLDINQVITSSGDGNNYYPILNLHITINCHPHKTEENKIVPYTLVEIAGQLFMDSKLISESFKNRLFYDIYERSNSYGVQVKFPLDTKRIERIEDIRRGGTVTFQLTLNGLAYFKSSTMNLAEIRSVGSLPVEIPQSHWVTKILSVWNYGQAKLIELYFPKTYKHEILKGSYQHIDKAISHFNNGNDSETMASIYKAFEFMAKQLDCSGPDQSFFSKLLENIEDEKREKLKLLLDYFCRYLHLGRHELSKPPVSIERKDSEFALAMAQVIYAYLSKILPDE